MKSPIFPSPIFGSPIFAYRASSSSWLATAALATATVFCAAPAMAQLASNSKAPVDVVADNLETSNTDCKAVWRGNAEALQDTARLRADVLRIFNKPGAKPAKGAGASGSGGGCGDMERMEAEGSVYYVTSDGQKIRANKAVYEAGSTVVTMTGDVIAVRGQNVLRGDRMVFNTQTGEGQVEGASKGRGAKDRPRGVFYPEQSNATSDKPK
jgi:lipopolysaccharide export system protein LptA